MPREHSPASSRSDSDSDLEPDQLITKFLVLQSRLHEISPELTEGNAKASKHARGRSSRNCNRLDANAKRKTARVRSKMERIRSDPLFDEDTANRKWAETRVQSARESAERKRFGIPDNNRGAQQEAKSTTICSLGPTETTQDDSDADGILGEFFSSLPDTRTDLSGGVSSVSISGQNGKSVQIRDFGRWNGISPRRILEEACRAR